MCGGGCPGRPGCGLDACGSPAGRVPFRQRCDRVRLRALEERAVELGALGQGRRAGRDQPRDPGETEAGGCARQGGHHRLARGRCGLPEGSGPEWRAAVRSAHLRRTDRRGRSHEHQIHGNAVTHMDAFGHRFFDGKMYNGFSWEELTKPDSTRKESIYDVHDGVLTRGVLIDIPRLKGVEYLEPGTRIYVQDIEAWEKKANVRVSPGDALLIRYGPMAVREEERRPGDHVRRARSIGHPVAQEAGCRHPWRRGFAGCDAAAARLPPAGNPRLLPRRAGRAHPGQRQPRRAGRRGGCQAPLGIHARGGAAGHSRRDRLAVQPDRGLLALICTRVGSGARGAHGFHTKTRRHRGPISIRNDLRGSVSPCELRGLRHLCSLNGSENCGV